MSPTSPGLPAGADDQDLGDYSPTALRVYLSGKIDQWWSRQDQPGVVFLVNATTIEEAECIRKPVYQGK